MTVNVRTDRWERWSVTGVGVFLGSIVVGFAVVDSAEPADLQIVQFGIPILLAAGLATYGGWLVTSDVSPAGIRRIALWSLVGAIALAAFSSWEMYAHILEGETLAESAHELLYGLTEGAAIGGLVGYYDDRRMSQYVEARKAKQAISASMDGIATLDEDGAYQSANQAHADVYGYDDPEAFVGETWHMCYTDAEAARVEEEAISQLYEEGSWRGELTGKRRDGSTFPQEVTLSTLENGGLVCVVRDVADRRAYEDRLKALNRASGAMMTAETEEDIAEVVVETANQILDQRLTAVWSYDADADRLVPLAATDTATEVAETANTNGGLLTLQPGTVEMQIFRSGESTVIEDYQAVENPGAEVPLGTLLVVPLGDHGQLNVGSLPVREVSPADRQLVEILGQNARLALDAVEREQTLVERERRLRVIVENTPLILFTIDQHRRVTFAVGKGLDRAPVEETDLIGEQIDDLFENAPAVVEAVDRSLDGETVDVELDIWGRSFRVWYEPVEIYDGNTSVIGVAMDITEQQRRERGIRALHEATRAMMQETDREAICRIAVDTAQDALGLPVSGIWLRPDDRSRLEPVAWSTQADEQFDELPVFEPGNSLSWQAYDDGEIRVFDDVREAEDRYDSDTEMRSELIIPIGEYGVMNSGSTAVGQFDEIDVALAQLLAANTRAALERGQREEKLQHQTDQMEFFNSILRHDVLNGMTVIRGRAEFLTEELEGQQLTDAETILKWSDDITTIIQRVRRVLETLTGQGDPQIRPIDLADVLRPEIARVRTTYPEIAFETEIPDGVTVQANELLGEVLGNVITNAVSHNDTDGLRISVTVEAPAGEDDRVTVRITDNGRGVPDEVKESIFRRDATGHAKSTGSGFGLFFVDSMVAEYGGDVWVEDADPSGAAFVIELPSASS